ncbi:hypothetical protein OSB04_024958 [Centaurea solstitialis]|uniref:Uncharacterized protein n=1 Tax=Centaurea solstitialis TaxID=347529 RepID=A0AA38T0J4_9ASTR|nr:hypothetical protein OSB04_024958 [Centaurea solstitialis]
MNSVYVREPHALDELWGPTRVATDGRKGVHMPLSWFGVGFFLASTGGYSRWLLRDQCLSFIDFIAKKIQEVENVYKDYAVEILEVEFRVNLISSFMKEIDMVIDTDWLSRKYLIVDGAGQMVRIQGPSGGELVVYGKRERTKTTFFSVAKRRRYLQHGCTVSEFPNVPPEDLWNIRSIEKKNRTLVEAARTMLAFSKLLLHF